MFQIVAGKLDGGDRGIPFTQSGVIPPNARVKSTSDYRPERRP
jgi:hypothetical protein